MEFLLILLISIIGLAAFDLMAVDVGVDSRPGADDQHAPLYGAS